MLWIGLFTLGILNIINPSNFVARTNYQLMQQGRQFDANYHANELDEDALPTLVEILPALNDRQKCEVENGLTSSRYHLKDNVGMWNWNYSRWKAKEAFEHYKADRGLTNLEWKKCYELYPESDVIR